MGYVRTQKWWDNLECWRRHKLRGNKKNLRERYSNQRNSNDTPSSSFDTSNRMQREPREIDGYEIHLKTKVTVNAKLMRRSCMLAWCYEFYFREFCLQLNWIQCDSLWIYPFGGRKEDVPRSKIWSNQYWTSSCSPAIPFWLGASRQNDTRRPDMTEDFG